MKAMPATFVAIIMVSIILFGCSQTYNGTPVAGSQQAPLPENRMPSPIVSSLAAVENPGDSGHIFIRTADIKFKVENVASATYCIEDVIRQLGGYVSYTNLASKINGKNLVAVSADSSLQTTYYQVENTMVIRVPNMCLDSALKSLAPLVAYLDYRQVKANDVTLQLLSNRLKQTRIAKHTDKMNRAIDESGEKLAETTNAHDALLNKQEQADNAWVDNMAITGQVEYSTINLSLYQTETACRQMVFNEKSIVPFEPGLKVQMEEAAQLGWVLFTGILIFAVRLWPLIMIAAGLVFGYRRFKKLAL